MVPEVRAAAEKLTYSRTATLADTRLVVSELLKLDERCGALKAVALELLEQWRDSKGSVIGYECEGRTYQERVDRVAACDAQFADYRARIEAAEPEAGRERRAAEAVRAILPMLPLMAASPPLLNPETGT